MSKHHQHRPKTRAPHGSPEFTERVAFYCTAKQKRAFMRLGGSQFGRDAIDAAALKKR